VRASGLLPSWEDTQEFVDGLRRKGEPAE